MSDEELFALIVMCKAPFAGQVKTRLTPFLSPKQAASLAASFAQDAVLKTRNLSQNIAYAPPNGKAALKRILPQDLSWLEQTGNDLGERMHNAFVELFKTIYAPLVMIGTDSPTLPPEFIFNAFAILSERRADVVLGATHDGGYYLIGLNQPDSRIFAGVEWSSPRTFEQTAANVEKLNYRLELLPTWYDVDTPEDLWRLREEILTDEKAAAIAVSTAEWLRLNENLFQISASSE